MFLVFHFLIWSCLILVLSYVCYKYIYYKKKYLKYRKYLYNYLSAITSARYGNFNYKIENGIDIVTTQLSNDTNTFFESVKDRDKMLKEYIEKERQHHEIQKDFISTLTHDLKVPIIAQENTYELFLNGNFGQLTQLQSEVINNLKISNLDLKNLVINLLDVQKSDIEEFKIESENIDLVEFIKQIIELNKSLLMVKNKEINFDYNIDHLLIDLDSLLIKRALNNLISNAIYYSKNSKIVTIKLEKKDDIVEISIIDKGDGIKEDEIENIFNRYYTAAKKYSNIGIGLGLYIANKIIIAHNGKIVAKNNKDKGACFTIKLPCNKN